MSINRIPDSLKQKLGGNSIYLFIFVAIFAVGIFARTWEFRNLPPGLNQDEAENGVEAMSLYRYGVDRNGISFPVRFISWGSGQDALYGYILIPFVAIGGLTPFTVRFPMLLIGIATLPLTYLLGKKLRDAPFGLILMFLTSISPWHIMYSRWGLEVTLLPFFFLLGFLCILESRRENYWFILACIFLALCLYSYITSYLAIPLFVIMATPLLVSRNRLSVKALVGGLGLLAILASPLILYIAVNRLNLNSIHVGPVTIPRLPSTSRTETDIAMFQGKPIEAIFANFTAMIKMLVLQSDGFITNSTKYGYLYTFTFPFIIVGAFFFLSASTKSLETKLLLFWSISAVVIGLFTKATFNRLNFIFIPLFVYCTSFIEWLRRRNRPIFLLSIAALLAGFTSFTIYYHNSDYRHQADRWYFTGLLSALNYVKESNSNSICVTTTKINMPYIFVLFSEQMDASVGPNKTIYSDPNSQFRTATSDGRYFFGIENCPISQTVAYILFFTEHPPTPRGNFDVRDFGIYRVYAPK